MKIAVVDLNSRTPKYDKALTDALNAEQLDVVLMTPDKTRDYYKCRVKTLFRLYKKPQTEVNRLKKIIDVFVNYFLVIYYCNKFNIRIVHFQWLPLIEYCSFPSFILRLLSKKRKILLTVHNIFPHNIDVNRAGRRALSYKKRFISQDKYVDGYIVHTNSSKKELSDCFNIDPSKIHVCYHGLFEPNKYILNNKNKSSGDLFSILMFGIQSMYKGTDLLIRAAELLPKDTASKIRITIAGISSDYHNTIWFQKAKELNIKWIDRLLDNDELDSLISESDLLVFPYRSISQSGALLQALSFGIPILASNLPSFVETLKGMDNNAFFETENVQQFADRIYSFVNGQVDIRKHLSALQELQKLYSWENTAQQTKHVYNNF